MRIRPYWGGARHTRPLSSPQDGARFAQRHFYRLTRRLTHVPSPPPARARQIVLHFSISASLDFSQPLLPQLAELGFAEHAARRTAGGEGGARRRRRRQGGAREGGGGRGGGGGAPAPAGAAAARAARGRGRLRVGRRAAHALSSFITCSSRPDRLVGHVPPCRFSARKGTSTTFWFVPGQTLIGLPCASRGFTTPASGPALDGPTNGKGGLKSVVNLTIGGFSG